MFSSLVILSLFLAADLPNEPPTGQPPPSKIVADANSDASSKPPLAKKEPDPIASEASMQVLEIASKNVDMSSSLVSMAAYVLGALGIVLAVATLLIQVIGATSRKRAVDAAIKRTLDGLATNTDFAELVLQEIIQKQKLKDYIFKQIDEAVRQTAETILTKEYFEARSRELGVKWNELNNHKS
ncbi:hypothetical protein KBB96_20115 [Luteolibacter ambystomatis]|uniref:Uncharacterized protein n=1 Tax=Luteolibacter ambystomatis TaxID=2824561 RepID=A0A975G886_9BACT|nr:hypothetical protein [Luteolibacter ambystomatis]QUE51147.1 hypothetical protein KBB96_20115 [Luteolibacter ambystomatis]